MDSTFEMEKRRNRPIKYDRNLVGTTLRAMQKAGEVQAKRAEIHYKNRMSEHRLKATERARVEIKEQNELIAGADSLSEKAMLAIKESQMQAVKA